MNAEHLVLRARAGLTEESDTVLMSIETLYALIPLAISTWIAELLETNSERLNDFFVEHTVTAASGVANLNTAVSAGLRLDCLKSATIIVTTDEDDEPEIKVLQLVNSYTRLSTGGIQDDWFVTGAVVGKSLMIRDPFSDGDNPMTAHNGDLKIQGITEPSNVTNLPDSDTAALALHLIDVAKKQIRESSRGKDIAARKA